MPTSLCAIRQNTSVSISRCQMFCRMDEGHVITESSSHRRRISLHPSFISRCVRVKEEIRRSCNSPRAFQRQTSQCWKQPSRINKRCLSDIPPLAWVDVTPRDASTVSRLSVSHIYMDGEEPADTSQKPRGLRCQAKVKAKRLKLLKPHEPGCGFVGRPRRSCVSWVLFELGGTVETRLT